MNDHRHRLNMRATQLRLTAPNFVLNSRDTLSNVCLQGSNTHPAMQCGGYDARSLSLALSPLVLTADHVLQFAMHEILRWPGLMVRTAVVPLNTPHDHLHHVVII